MEKISKFINLVHENLGLLMQAPKFFMTIGLVLFGCGFTARYFLDISEVNGVRAEYSAVRAEAKVIDQRFEMAKAQLADAQKQLADKTEEFKQAQAALAATKVNLVRAETTPAVRPHEWQPITPDQAKRLHDRLVALTLRTKITFLCEQGAIGCDDFVDSITPVYGSVDWPAKVNGYKNIADTVVSGQRGVTISGNPAGQQMGELLCDTLATQCVFENIEGHSDSEIDVTVGRK